MLLDHARVVGSFCINDGIIIPIGCRITETILKLQGKTLAFQVYSNNTLFEFQVQTLFIFTDV